MRLQLLRDADEHTIGIALIFAKQDHVLPVLEGPFQQEPDFWRTCDACTANEAMVFCKTHAIYLCESCLSLHKPIPKELCWYLSMASARALLLQDLQQESHT